MKKYKLIIADPPWQYFNKMKARNQKTGELFDVSSRSRYNTLSIKEICDLPIIKQIVDKNCVLFLWSTAPMLADAFTVMKAWGFKYKTVIVWRKVFSLGLGFWFRGQCEFCLLGIKGKVKAFRCQKPNFFQTHMVKTPLKHSQKPEDIFQLIEPIMEKYNLHPAIELFARRKRKGWDCWGDGVK